jgi:mRNA-degrading endonuclease RelE of RelBE toxin-antitoxin system
MPYAIPLTDLAARELDSLSAFDRTRFLKADFASSPPIWELRVGDFRAFYDVQETNLTVFVRAVRRKDPDETTEDILHERNDP